MGSNGHSYSLWPYFWVLIALFVLTGATVGAAYIDFGHPWGDVVALAIAVCKASFVVIFFMHVRGSSPLIKLAAAGGFFWMLVFIAFILSDIMERTTLVDGWTPMLP